jgi:hypothetical protein
MLVIFEIGSYLMLWLAWTTILLFSFSHITGMTDMHHHAQPFVEKASCKLFTRTGLEPLSS